MIDWTHGTIRQAVLGHSQRLYTFRRMVGQSVARVAELPDRRLATATVEEYISAARVALARQLTANPGAHVIDPRVILPRLLLHMYQRQVRSADVLPVAERELGALLSEEAPTCVCQPEAPPPFILTATKLDFVLPGEAKFVHERCHYLASFRSDGVHLGLRLIDDRLVATATLSPLDVEPIIRRLSGATHPSAVLMLSRLFAIQNAPKNTLSYFLGRLANWVRTERRDVTTLLTYLDPNLGFTGVVYRAANWFRLFQEPKSGYEYLDGRYMTSRKLRERFGTGDFAELRGLLGGRISRSPVNVKPLDVYATHVR